MSMRPLAALGLAGMIVLACVSLTKAEIPYSAFPSCIAKDQVIIASARPGLHYRKVTGGDADAIRVHVNNLDPSEEADKPGYTYVVFWTMKSEDVLIVGFDEHNCFKYQLGVDKKPVFDLIGQGL